MFTEYLQIGCKFEGGSMSRLVLSAAVSAAVFATTLGAVAYNADAEPRHGHDSVPDVLPEPETSPVKPSGETPPTGVLGPMTAVASPAPLPTKPTAPEPAAAPTAKPAEKPAEVKRATPRHAKPRHRWTERRNRDGGRDGGSDAGSYGPFSDAEGDGKILDDFISTMIPDDMLPLRYSTDRTQDTQPPRRMSNHRWT